MAGVKHKLLYQQLTEFIVDKLPKRYQSHFSAWMENGKLINAGKNITDYGIELAHINYDAVLFFDELPFNEINPTYLMALIQIWLNEHDQLRDILDDYEINFDIEIINDEVADLTFTLTFQEPLTAVFDEKGGLNIDGSNCRIDEIEIYTAQFIETVVEIKGDKQ